MHVYMFTLFLQIINSKHSGMSSYCNYFLYTLYCIVIVYVVNIVLRWLDSQNREILKTLFIIVEMIF